ncbi:MAG: hypothetical protein IJF73_02110 [Clostridia bacterium]|nr:hypothetical protein [Clostridia bacterium]
MTKFFAAIGYIASVLAAATGLLWLINKLTDREIEEELECECECCEDECGDECECCAAEDASADEAVAE